MAARALILGVVSFTTILAPATAQIIADFSVDQTVGWPSFDVTFTNLSTYPADPEVEFFWDFGDGEFSAAEHPTHTYTFPGVFNVSLAVHANGDVGQVTKHELIRSLELIVDFSAIPLAGPPRLTVDFTNHSTPVDWPIDYVWSFGDGGFSTDKDPQHIYLENGFYNVTLQATAVDGPTKTHTKFGYIRVGPTPFLQIANDCVDATAIFPTVETRAFVSTMAGRACALDASNFSVWEDGVPQTVETIECGNAELSAADFVFVIDRSGSMQFHINAVRDGAAQFAADAIESGVNARFGLITYADLLQVLDLPLTDDVSEFEAALDAVVLTGALEPALDSVIFALENMEFRACAKRVIILITDEVTNGDTHTMPETIDAVLEAGVTVVAISPNFGFRTREFTGPKDNNVLLTRATDTDDDVRILAEETGGFWVDIVFADYSAILEEIIDFVTSVWVVTYTTTNTTLDGSDREVMVTVDDPLEGEDTKSYVYTAPATADYAVRNAFRSLDQDGDGLINRAESGLTPAAFFGYDINGDGFLSLEELLEWTVGPVGVTSPVWVDFDYAGSEAGSAAKPFNTLDEGLAFVAPGGEVRLAPAATAQTYSGPYGLNKPVQVVTTGGTATVGSLEASSHSGFWEILWNSAARGVTASQDD